jgi:hypothetical protein
VTATGITRMDKTSVTRGIRGVSKGAKRGERKKIIEFIKGVEISLIWVVVKE